ncbi:type VI secretion system domain-containing protein [Helicobacter pullorum]|uniref:type VI secretion system domain-containing protein n=4 Tax=Helicobacter pullorum TaxID=35818 RepID=UPI000980C428|nr:type VI secretion system domain-containing protein [Helicobacter pullorum]
MNFYDYLKLESNLESLQDYHLLETEMAKYKTLNHSNIQWEIVYELSLEILQSHSLDMKFCLYLTLACIQLNNEEKFGVLLEFLKYAKEFLWQENTTTISKKQKEAQKKKLKNIIITFTEAGNSHLNIASHIDNFNNLLIDFENLLSCQFTRFEKQQNNKVDKSIPSEFSLHKSRQATDANTLDDRGYRDYYQQLACTILENDIDNINAYALLLEAMWGRIKTLPIHDNFLTQIRKPDKQLVDFLLTNKNSELEYIQHFIKNLSLNPFWLEGLKIFCEFLEKHNRIEAKNIISISVNHFINKFYENIIKLKFENGELFCKEEILNYFLEKNSQPSQQVEPPKETNPKNNKKIKKDFEKIFADINEKNNGDSIFHNINILREMAKTFEEKGMQKNAEVIYTQLINIMEQTPLKDYLLEDYMKAKEKTNRVQLS